MVARRRRGCRPPQRYPVKITVFCDDRAGMLKELTAVISDDDTNIRGVDIRQTTTAKPPWNSSSKPKTCATSTTWSSASAASPASAPSSAPRSSSQPPVASDTPLPHQHCHPDEVARATEEGSAFALACFPLKQSSSIDMNPITQHEHGCPGFASETWESADTFRDRNVISWSCVAPKRHV